MRVRTLNSMGRLEKWNRAQILAWAATLQSGQWCMSNIKQHGDYGQTWLSSATLKLRLRPEPVNHIFCRSEKIGLSWVWLQLKSELSKNQIQVQSFQSFQASHSYSYCRVGQPYTVGVCRCLPGWVAWKWECYPRAWLGQSCITSAQCVSKVISHHGDDRG